MRVSIKDTVPEIALLGCYSDDKKGTAQRCHNINSINILGIVVSEICDGFMKKINELNEISGKSG